MTSQNASINHTPAYATADLTNCDREPIHIPGAIQPHGVLLALDESYDVVMASANCERMLGRPLEDVLGGSVRSLLGVATADAVGDALAGDDLGAPVRVDLPPGSGDLAGAEIDLVVHRSGSRTVVEIVPVSGPQPSPAVSYRSARSAMTRLTGTSTTAELCQQLAAEIRQLTGFDRVMVYRFDEEWNGEVIAEQRREDLNSFLGLHYPATDIPAQARRLYTVNWTRLISDVLYTPVPLEPVLDPATGAPLDLSHSMLRSVSPIHIEYLSNMGVNASMSVSIVKDDLLWGLVACHHYSGPLRVSFDAQSAAEFLGQTASQLIDDRERRDSYIDELHAGVVLSRITAALAADPRTVYDAVIADPRLLELVDAGGVALHADGRLLTSGDTPDADMLQRIADRLGAPDGRAVSSNHLSGLDPDFAAVSDVAAGALHIGNGPGRWMMWLRPEVVKTVEWGGDPTNQALALHEDPSVRLSPRKSFQKWAQIVRHCSVPWRPWQVDVVEALRQHLSGELLRRSHNHTAIAESLQRTIVLEAAPEFTHLDVFSRYRPAEGSQLGGDWWDAFEIADGRVVLTVGDVAGHGVSAATAMSQMRTALRAYMMDGHGPASCVDRLDALMATMLPGQTATVVVLLADPATGRIQMANAGHPPPLLLRGGSATPLAHASRPLLGVDLGSASTEELLLMPDDVLLLYTDGLVERRGVEIYESIDRLGRAAGTADRSGTLESWVDGLLTVVPGTVDDDLTVVALRLAT